MNLERLGQMWERESRDGLLKPVKHMTMTHLTQGATECRKLLCSVRLANSTQCVWDKITGTPSNHGIPTLRKKKNGVQSVRQKEVNVSQVLGCRSILFLLYSGWNRHLLCLWSSASSHFSTFYELVHTTNGLLCFSSPVYWLRGIHLPLLWCFRRYASRLDS